MIRGTVTNDKHSPCFVLFFVVVVFFLQEIVGTLVTHIGSGFASEADASLDVLSDLVESHPDVMAPFAIFIKVI